jgi:hypothetical protein
MELKKRITGMGLLLFGSMLGFALPAQAGKATPVSVASVWRLPEDTLKIKVEVVDNRVIVSDAPAGSKLEIYNIVGLKVKEIKIKHSSEEYTVSLPKGYYILRIRETVRKIVVR